MSGIQLFTPKAVGTRTITCAASTATVAFAIPASAETVRISNVDTSNAAFIEFGSASTVTCILPSGSTLGGMCIPAGQTVGVGVPLGTTHVATICSAGTPILYLTPGNGV